MDFGQIAIVQIFARDSEGSKGGGKADLVSDETTVKRGESTMQTSPTDAAAPCQLAPNFAEFFASLQRLDDTTWHDTASFGDEAMKRRVTFVISHSTKSSVSQPWPSREGMSSREAAMAAKTSLG